MSDPVRDGLAEMLADIVASTPPFVPSTADLGYGIDLVCFDDIDPDLAETDPATLQSLQQDNYHRVSTATGSLPDDLDWGFDLTEYLNRGTTDQELQALGGKIETELLKDDRNGSVSAVVTVVSSIPLGLNVRITCSPADPDLVPFTLILTVDTAGVILQAIEA